MLQPDTCQGLDSHPATVQTSGRHGFSRIEKTEPDRRLAEEKIRAGYGLHFGACIEGFMPNMAIYRDATGSSGVIGFRRASTGPLFLENYLDHPVEAQVYEATGTRIRRDRLAEIGQFVIDDRDCVAAFFRDLVTFLIEQDFDWVCFTGTNRIRALLARIGFHGLPLAAASDRVNLPPTDHWGSYYDNDPVVIVGKLGDPEGGWCRQTRVELLRTGS